MAKFCVKCGTPLDSGPFCVKCGADTRSVANSVPPKPAPPAPQPVPQQPGPVAVHTTAAPVTPTQPDAAKAGMSPIAKLGIAALAVILVGGAAGAVGVYYVAHKVSQKYHEVSDGILGSGSSSGSTAEKGSRDASAKDSSRANGSLGDVCRFLKKEDVSKAIGVEIVRTDPGDNGCTYIAKGSQADMTAKHMKAMLADSGADTKSQEMAEKFAGGFFHAFAADKTTSEGSQEASGEVPVFTFSVDENSAEAQMRLNAKVLGNLGSQEGLPGIGDQAFVSADGMMFVRKGKSLVRIIYTTCPCGVEQVKPLAKEIANAL